jgi:hypothetical protein
MYKVTHTFKCYICGNEFVQSYSSDTVTNPIAILPAGWSQLPEGFVCGDHLITISDIGFTPDENINYL